MANLAALKAQQAQATGPLQSDCLLLATLGDNVGQMAYWQSAIPDMGTRVQIHKLKLGVIKSTRVAHKQQLIVRKQWNNFPQYLQKDLLLCPCGEGDQSTAHLFTECALAKPILEAGLPSQGTPSQTFTDILKTQHHLVPQILRNVETMELAMGISHDDFLAEANADCHYNNMVSCNDLV